MTPQDRLRISIASARYLEALENDDGETLFTLMEQATSDPELLHAFLEIDAAFLEEQHQHIVDTTRDTVEGLVEKHLPSAEIVKPVSGVVTVADVADELFHYTPGGLPAEAHQMNERLRAARDELPESLGLPDLRAWAEAKFGPAPVEYWRAFRQAAIKVRMRTRAEVEFQMAARRTKPKSGGTP